MREFTHIAAGLRLFCGRDSLKSLPAELDRVNSSKVAVFCGATVAANPDLLGAVQRILGARCAAVFDGVRAHSPTDAVEAGADLLRKSQADAVVAIGGGSAVVTARAASILAAEKGTLRELCSYLDSAGKFQSPRLMSPKLPQFVVPTSPSTAMVKAGSAVLDARAGRRLTMLDPKTRAQAIFIQPDFAQSAPRQLVLTASLNTLAMAVEGIESQRGDLLSDGMLMQSLRLLARNLSLLMEQQVDSEVRTQLMLAAILCGQGTDHASPGVAAALGHSLGIRMHLDNGLASGIVLPHTMRFNASATKCRIGKLAEALGRPASCDPADSAIGAVEALLASVHIPRQLRATGVPRDALREVAECAMEDWFLHRNSRSIAGVEDVLAILEAAW